MKKRIAMALCMLLSVLLLGACGTDPTTVDYNGYSYEDLRSETLSCCEIAQGIAGVFKEYELTEDDITEEEREAFIAYNNLTEAQFDSGFRWLEVEQEAGAFSEIEEEHFSVEKAGNTLTTNIRIRFEKRDVDFQVVYTYYNMEISGITIEPVYSMSEKLTKAGLNTLISIMIVFCMLIVISLLIAGFNVFPYMEKKKEEKKTAQAKAEVPVEQFINQIGTRETREEQRLTDDTELIAVIAAAIAAAEGTSVGDFVVRSINRRK